MLKLNNHDYTVVRDQLRYGVAESGVCKKEGFFLNQLLYPLTFVHHEINSYLDL